MNQVARLALLSVAVVLLAALPIRAQDTEVPRTRTFTGVENPAFPYAEPEQVGLSSEQLARLGDEVTSWVANGDLVGAELLIVKDGRAVFHEAYGWADREERRPVERGSIWSIKSMSKPFTATAILMLAEEGNLSLDDPVSRYIPTFAGDERTTIHHLLSHTSGTGGLGDTGGFESLAAWVEDWARDEPENPFGAYSYSDFGYAALGYIVEAVSGGTVEAFLAERIIDPLGLTETHTAFSPDAAWAHRVPSRYEWNADAVDFRPYWTNENPQGWPFYPAAWGLWATAMDYAEFLSMWLDKGRYRGHRFLNEESVEAALAPQSPALSDGVHYGYGWYVWPSGGGMPERFGHGGYDGTRAVAFTSSRTLVIYLTHSRGTPHRRALANRLSLLGGLGIAGNDMVWTEEADIEPITLSEVERSRYVGTYRGQAPGGAGPVEVVGKVWEADGHLHIRFGRLGEATDWRFHLVPLSDRRFAHGRYVDGRVEAVEEGVIERFLVEDGRVVGFEQLVDGQPSLSMTRADPEQVRAEIETERNRVAIDDLIAGMLEAEGTERAREIHTAVLAVRPDTVILAESLLNGLGYRLLRAARTEEAIAVFEMNVEAYPEQPNPYDSLADAYRAAGRLEDARQYYARAVELGERTGHEFLESYRRKLKRITDLLEGR